MSGDGRIQPTPEPTPNAPLTPEPGLEPLSTTMLETLLIIETVALLVGAPLLALYLRERVKTLAREATDKALADYTHNQNQVLAGINAAHERRLREFGLFAGKQHRVYARMYQLVRMAADGYRGLIGLYRGPNFKEYDLLDIREYVKRNGLRDSDAGAAISAFEKGDSHAKLRAMDDLDFRVRRRDADNAFQRAKNFAAIHGLYLSDEVRA